MLNQYRSMSLATIRSTTHWTLTSAPRNLIQATPISKLDCSYYKVARMAVRLTRLRCRPMYIPRLIRTRVSSARLALSGQARHLSILNLPLGRRPDLGRIGAASAISILLRNLPIRTPQTVSSSVGLRRPSLDNPVLARNSS